MSEIKVRNATQSEFRLNSVEEFVDLIRAGGITPEWEVYHATAQRWLPVTRHPVFAAAKQGG